MATITGVMHTLKDEGTLSQKPSEKGIVERVLAIFKQTDLTQTLRNITLQEVQQHATAEDGWTIIEGKVYDVTAFAKIHPGGSAYFKPCFGTDGTAHFRSGHRYRQIQTLKPYLIGTFSRN